MEPFIYSMPKPPQGLSVLDLHSFPPFCFLTLRFPPFGFPPCRFPPFWLKCCTPTAGGLLAASILAPPEMMKKRLYSQVTALWGAVRQRSIFLPAVFVFLWQVRSNIPTRI